MNWNFRELYYGVCQDVRDTTLTTLAKRWTNEVIADFYTRKEWNWANGEWAFITTANTMLYSLPPHIGSVISVRDKAARSYMELLSAAQFQQQVPDPTSTGYSRSAIYHGLVPYKQPLQSAITLVSSSASDTGTVTVRGMCEGYEQSESVTLTGLTEVDTTKTYSKLYSVVAGSAVTGTITLYDAADNSLGTIAAAGTTATISSQPATKLSVVSSSAADAAATDADDIMRIRGYNGDGVYLEETMSLTGTTAAVTANSYNQLEEVTKKQTSTGIITVTSGSRTVAKIAPNQLASQYIMLGLFPIPDAAREINLRYKLQPPKLVEDHDGFAPIPQECFPVLKDGVMAKAWDYLKYPQRAQMSLGAYIDGVSRMWAEDARRVPSKARMNAANEPRSIINYPRTVGA